MFIVLMEITVKITVEIPALVAIMEDLWLHCGENGEDNTASDVLQKLLTKLTFEVDVSFDISSEEAEELRVSLEQHAQMMKERRDDYVIEQEDDEITNEPPPNPPQRLWTAIFALRSLLKK